MKLLQKMMNLFFNSCKRTTELIEKKKIAPLNATDELQLKFHKMMCKTCNTYEYQSEILDKAIYKIHQSQSSIVKFKLSEEQKFKIKSEIESI